MKRTRLFLVWGGALAVLAVAVVVILLALEGERQRTLINNCKTLQLGKTEQEVVAVLGQPTNKGKATETGREVEVWVFEPPGILPNPAPQLVYIEIDPSTKRAVQIVCDENFHLRAVAP